MDPRTFSRSIVAIAATFAASLLLAASAPAQADPPSRVARLAYAEGAVSFAPAGDGDWVRAIVNRPLVTGDRLWSDSDGRVEIQFATTAVRLGPMTDVVLVNLDDRMQQFQLTQGALQLRVRNLGPGEQVEVDTPNFAFVATRPGDYRLDVEPDGSATRLFVRSGEGDVYGDGAAYHVSSGQAVRFAGTALSDAEYLALSPPDPFERWAQGRDQRYGRLVSARYVAPDVVGFEDLDQYGTWRTDATYGNVWIPRSVPADWAPYRNGHWSWIDPWGWTWVDDAPWGFAPFHYGRWAEVGNGWGWVPGPPRQRAVYAPALVAFIGGAGFAVSASSGPSIGWFPLAPGEVYRPAYTVSRDYFTRVNVTNTVVNTTIVTNVYNTRDRPGSVRYANMQRPAAITAVAPAAFAQSQPVQRAHVAVNAQVLNRAEVVPLATVAPQRQSVTGAAPPARAAPAAAAQRAVVSRAAPPPPPATLESKLPAMREAPGKPIDRPANNARPAAPGAPAPAAAPGAPQARVVNATAPKPLPAKAPGGNGRGANAAEKGPGGAPAPSAAPSAPPSAAAPAAAPAATSPQATPAAPAGPPRGNAERPRQERGKGNDGAPPGRAPEAPAARPPQAAVPAPTLPAPTPPAAAPPQGATPPQAQPQPQPADRMQEPRGNGKGRQQREQQSAPPPTPPQNAAPRPAPIPAGADAPAPRPPAANVPQPAPAAPPPAQPPPQERGKGKGAQQRPQENDAAQRPPPQNVAPRPAPAPPAPPAAAPPPPPPAAAPAAPAPQVPPAPRNENRGKGKDDDKDKDKDKEKK